MSAIARPARRFLRWQQASLFLSAAAAAAGAAVGGQIPAAALVAFGAAWTAGLVLRERTSRPLAVVVNLATVLGVPLVLMPALGDRSRLPVAAAEATLVLCANRLLVRRGPTDDAMLHLACWLVLASGAALTGELLYGICLLAYAVLASVSMLLAELRRGIEAEAPDQAEALLGAPELTSRRLLAYAASLGLFALAFGALVFPFFPRGRLGLLQVAGGGGPRTGISDHVDLSTAGTLQDSSRVVLRAELSGGAAVLQYWRVLTLDVFTGRGWLPVEDSGTLVAGLRRPGTPAIRGSFDLFPDALRLVPAPEGLLDLWPIRPALRLRELANGDLRLGRGAAGPIRFAFRARMAGPAMAPDPRESERALQLPALSPRVVSLARRLIPNGASREAAIEAVVRYLSGFRYSRELHSTGTPLDDFLTRKSGHCELFATAVAVLLRARGIPARYVAGYYTPPEGSQVTVRDWDAHAWAEALLPDRGFVLVDATPPDLRGPNLDHSRLWQEFLDLWDSAQLHWLRDVVDFDSGAQAQTAGWLVRHLTRSVWALLPSQRVKWTLLGALVIALLALSGRRWLRPAAAAVRLERELFRRLARRDIVRRPAETHEEVLRRIEARDRLLAQHVAAILKRLAAARFGGRPLAPAETERLRARVRRT